MNSWTGDKLGYRGENKGPRSILCVRTSFDFIFIPCDEKKEIVQ
jgi:hypothetical protein